MAIADILTLLLGNLVILYTASMILWFVSLKLRDASIIDIFWGIFCALPAILTYCRVDGTGPRDLVITLCATAWALRLSSYLAKRNIGHGEDERYVAMRRAREAHGDFARWSLVWVFLLQSSVAFVVSLPVQVGQIGSNDEFGVLTWLGFALFAFGLSFETIGDAQLSHFKRDPQNHGKLMDKGLWAWTRHPNYFGDACVWFGLAVMALSSPFGWMGIFSPFIMAFFLVKVSGKALLERNMSRKYGAAYDDYKKRTSGFIPLPPKKRS